MDMVQLLFSRLPQFKEDPKWVANMKKVYLQIFSSFDLVVSKCSTYIYVVHVYIAYALLSSQNIFQRIQIQIFVMQSYN